jgi:hypothetical protein
MENHIRVAICGLQRLPIPLLDRTTQNRRIGLTPTFMPRKSLVELQRYTFWNISPANLVETITQQKRFAHAPFTLFRV